MNVPKWVQEVFIEEDNDNIVEDFFQNKDKYKFYKDKNLDDIWYLVVIEGADNDISYFTEADMQPLIRSFYRRATKEDWDIMREKYDDDYTHSLYIAYEQLSYYYDELFRRNCKRFNVVLC